MSQGSSPRGRDGAGRAGSRLLVALLLAGTLLLSGCVSVPVSGPATPIDGQAAPCQNCVNVEVEPPFYGDEPKQIVEGYLRATSVYQPNYAVAKQFLTRAAAEKWSPEDGAQIYSGNLAATSRSTVVLDGTLQGSLGPDRSYTAASSAKRWDFKLVQEDRQWRISTPPPGLMIAENYFSRFYTSYNLYFIGNGSLVPDPIYLPNLPNQANVASVLMQALLEGPSRWLRPAVTSAIPADTALSVGSVTVQDGVAEVPLSDAVLPLNDAQRGLLAAQVVYTLKQAPVITAVAFKVNSNPFKVPYGDEDSFQVPVDNIPSDVDPVPFIAGDELYAVRGRTVALVSSHSGAPTPQPMAGPLGMGKFEVDSLAVSGGNTDIAVVTDHRTVLRGGLTATGAPSVKLSGQTNLLRPQYSRYGELWTIGDSGGRQRMWTFAGDRPVEVGAALMAGGRVTAFRISPDGTRMALVRSNGTRDELGMARISRSDKITVDGWRPLNTTQPNSSGLTRIRDVAWVTANNLMVLGSVTATGSMVPYQISQDGSQITAPSEAKDWDAVELANLMGTDTSVVVDRSGRLYKDDGDQWVAFADKCRTAAFPS